MFITFYMAPKIVNKKGFIIYKIFIIFYLMTKKSLVH